MKIYGIMMMLCLYCVLSPCYFAWSAPHSAKQGEVDALPQVEFRVIQVIRPRTRIGKNFNQTPRDIYLYASRPPLDKEKSTQSENTWLGRELKVYRLEKIDNNLSYPSKEQLEWMDQLKQQQIQKEQQEKNELEIAKKQGSPIDLETPQLPSTALENQEDDDELEIQSLEEDQICGHENEACCIHAKKGQCELGLICQSQRCLPPPPPCGSLDQRCCDKQLPCIDGLVCRTENLTRSTEELCLLPPPVVSRKKLLVGMIRIVEVQKRLIRAQVVQDALNKNADSSNFAISIKDLAEFY